MLRRDFSALKSVMFHIHLQPKLFFPGQWLLAMHPDLTLMLNRESPEGLALQWISISIPKRFRLCGWNS